MLAVPAPDPSRRARRLGLVAALLMAVGGLGAGALPIPTRRFGLRLIGLPSRNVTLAIAVTYAGIVLMVLAWLWVAKMLRSHGAVAPAPTIAPAGAHHGHLGGAARAGAAAVLPRRLQLPRPERRARPRHRPLRVRPGGAASASSDPLVRSIPTIWRDTPAPYGPLFLVVGRGITALTGNDVVLGIFAYRVLALVGLALIIWTLPRLARRCGMDVGLALWLGVGNPLVLFHLVSGIHNESLMIGLMLAGIELGLRAGARILDPHLLGGAFLIVCASAVKLPALLVLGFLGLHWARLRGGRARDVAIAAGVLAAVTVVVYTPLSVGTGVGLGWTTTLTVPTLILSWMSVTTDLGLVGGQVGMLGGLGDHTTAVLSLSAASAWPSRRVLCARLLWLVFRGRLDPITGMAAGLGAVVLLGPVVHPWYVLWGADPAGRHPLAAPLPAGAARGVGRARGRGAADGGGLQLPRFPAADGARRGAGDARGAIPGSACASGRHGRRHRRPARARAGGPRDALHLRGSNLVHEARRACSAGHGLGFAPVSGAAVTVRGLVKRFGATTAVDGLDLELPAASVLALLGPNGAGKTTTVEVCTGFLAADAGEVRVLGTDPSGAPDALRARIGVMPQGGGAYPGVRAGEMLRLVAACSAHPLDPAWLLDVLGLTGCARTPYKRMSGGQQQRLALACAVVGRPELVFLDEPDRGPRPAGPPPGVGARRRAAPRRRGRAAHHAPHGGGRGARRRRGDRRPRPGGRPRQPGRVDLHRADSRSCGSGPSPAWTSPASPPRCRPSTAPPRRSRAATSCRADRPRGAVGDHHVVRGAGRSRRRRPGGPPQPRGRVPRR